MSATRPATIADLRRAFEALEHDASTVYNHSPCESPREDAALVLRDACVSALATLDEPTQCAEQCSFVDHEGTRCESLDGDDHQGDHWVMNSTGNGPLWLHGRDYSQPYSAHQQPAAVVTTLHTTDNKGPSTDNKADAGVTQMPPVDWEDAERVEAIFAQPRTLAEADAVLRSAGYDPEEVGKQMADFARAKLATKAAPATQELPSDTDLEALAEQIDQTASEGDDSYSDILRGLKTVRDLACLAAHPTAAPVPPAQCAGFVCSGSDVDGSRSVGEHDRHDGIPDWSQCRCVCGQPYSAHQQPAPEGHPFCCNKNTPDGNHIPCPTPACCCVTCGVSWGEHSKQFRAEPAGSVSGTNIGDDDNGRLENQRNVPAVRGSDQPAVRAQGGLSEPRGATDGEAGSGHNGARQAQLRGGADGAGDSLDVRRQGTASGVSVQGAGGTQAQPVPLPEIVVVAKGYRHRREDGLVKFRHPSEPDENGAWWERVDLVPLATARAYADALAEAQRECDGGDDCPVWKLVYQYCERKGECCIAAGQSAAPDRLIQPAKPGADWVYTPRPSLYDEAIAAVPLPPGQVVQPPRLVSSDDYAAAMTVKRETFDNVERIAFERGQAEAAAFIAQQAETITELETKLAANIRRDSEVRIAELERDNQRLRDKDDAWREDLSATRAANRLLEGQRDAAEARAEQAEAHAKEAGEILLETHRLRCNQPEAADVREMFRRLGAEDISSGKAVEIVLDMIAGAKAQQAKGAEPVAWQTQDGEFLRAGYAGPLMGLRPLYAAPVPNEARAAAFAECEAVLRESRSRWKGHSLGVVYECAADAIAALAKRGAK